MNLKNVCLLALACVLPGPLLAGTQTVVGVEFSIESSHLFPEQTLGNSKPQIESEMSRYIAERLEFYFPYLDWQAGAATDNRIFFKMTDRMAGLCDWQTSLNIRVYRTGNEIELRDVPPIPLYDQCNPAIPNRNVGAGLDPEDQQFLVATLKQAVEDSGLTHGVSGGFLNNKPIRDEIQRQFLRTIPVTLGFELREGPSGTGKFLYLPVSFDDMKALDEECDGSDDNCSRIRLKLKVPNDPRPATFTLRVAGICGDQVLCEVLKGGIPGGFNISQPTFLVDDALGNLLTGAEVVSLTMENFVQNSLPCSSLEP